MPIRLGKGMLKLLRHMAKNQQQGIRVNFLIDPLTSGERKAIRQLIKENEREAMAAHVRMRLEKSEPKSACGLTSKPHRAVRARLFPRDWKPLGLKNDYPDRKRK